MRTPVSVNIVRRISVISDYALVSLVDALRAMEDSMDLGSQGSAFRIVQRGGGLGTSHQVYRCYEFYIC